MLFQTRYNRQERPGEINSGENLVERAGYIPAKIQIENLINAGIRLKEHRAEMYDFKSLAEIDLDFHDPTRSKNFDIADAFQLKTALDLRLKASETAQKASETAQKASETAQQVSGEVLKEKKGEDVPLNVKSPE